MAMSILGTGGGGGGSADVESLNARLAADEEQLQEALRMIGADSHSLTTAQDNILRIKAVLLTLTTADKLNFKNAVLELLENANDVVIIRGYYDGTNKRLCA